MKLTTEQIEMLKNLKFEEMSESHASNINEYFGISPELHLNGNFGVVGDHAQDVAEFFYLDNMKTNGFYYSSSLFDTFYYGKNKEKLNDIVEELKNYCTNHMNINSKDYSINLTTETTNYTTWFIVECNLENDTHAKMCLESLVKASIVLDFLMQKFENDFYSQQENE